MASIESKSTNDVDDEEDGEFMITKAKSKGAEPEAPLGVKTKNSSKNTPIAETTPTEDNMRNDCSEDGGNGTKTFMFHCHLVKLIVLAFAFLSIGGIIGGFIGKHWDDSDDDKSSSSFIDDTATPTPMPTPTNDKDNNSESNNVDFSFTAASRFPPSGHWNVMPLTFDQSVSSATNAVELSSDGTILATLTDGGIQVFQKKSTTWTFLGDFIELVGHHNKLVLSNEGDVLAVGGYVSAVKVYSLVASDDDASWELQGQKLDKSNSLAISPDGGVVALCGEFYGTVSVYDYDGSQWKIRKKLSGGMNYECNEDTSLALSEYGEYLVIGDENGKDYNGQVSLFKYEESNDGGKLMEGGILYGPSGGSSSFGSTVKLSTQNGLIIAVGSRRYQNSYGLVQVFLYKDNGDNDKDNGISSSLSRSSSNNNDTAKLQQLGQDLMGSIDGAQYGWTMDLSQDGLVVAIGSGERSVANVYYLDDNKWKTPEGGPTNIASTGSFYGDVNSISLSSDGTTVVYCSFSSVPQVLSYN